MQRRIWTKKLGLLAAFVLTSWSQAFWIDGRIVIDRAANSPTLTVRYTGVAVAMAELRLNGKSVGTRTLSPKQTDGETNFELDLAALPEGESEIEVLLYDEKGKLLSSEKSKIKSQRTENSPVVLEGIKSGSTVQGIVEIRLNFKRDLKNVYTSFFVNDEFKSLKNYPPYHFVWDTARYPNGWHEVEAWVIDDTSNTYKTGKTRVFVNNPGGRTERVSQPEPAANASSHSGKPMLGVTDPIGVKVSSQSSGMKSSSFSQSKIIAASPKMALSTSIEPIKASVGDANGSKAVSPSGGVATGPRSLTPTGARVATENAGTEKINTVAAGTSSTTAALTGTIASPNKPGLVKIRYGERLAHSGSYAISLNASTVAFDVQPRVENGIPLTPFRHLFEHAGGKVDWEHLTKTLLASGFGREIWVKIGSHEAKVNKLPIKLEIAAFLEKGRTIVPLSFIEKTLDVEVNYDPETGHVLITTIKKK